MSVHEITHPLVKHKLGLLRQQSLSTRSFRQLTAEVGSLLTYEATSDLELEDYQVDTWMGPAPAQRIKGKKVTVVPILRAGIGMLDGVLELIPSAKVSVVGIGMRSHTGVAAKMFQVLSGEGINIKVITTSEIKISVLIDRKYMELAVQALHDAFELHKAA